MKRIVGALLLALVLAPAWAGGTFQTGWFGNTAVGGYDVVAYFDQGEAIRGSREYTTEWMGAEWRFASADHLAAFEAEPGKYAPQYGGHCAWAAAHGYIASGDPQQWTIVDGRLFLNYNAQVRQKWLPDRHALIERGDAHWPELAETL